MRNGFWIVVVSGTEEYPIWGTFRTRKESLAWARKRFPGCKYFPHWEPK